MEVLHRRCAGLDVHQAEIAGCVRIAPEEGKVQAQGRKFGTLPEDLKALREWLVREGVTHVAMEATGVYWLAIYEELESAGLDLTLCNAHHVKNVPGRKTDQSDAAWLAQLMASGLLRKSFVPDAETRQIRELTRARVHVIENVGRNVNAMHRLLERAGLKLCSVVTDLQGVTSQAILAEVAAGETDAKKLAKLAKGKLRKKRGELEAVLAVQLSPNERFLLNQHLALHRLLIAQCEELTVAIDKAMEPWKLQIERVMTLPGIDRVSATAILAELGPTLANFDSARQLAAWAGLAPGQRVSAGKRKRAGTREGNAYLKRILFHVGAANARMTKSPSDLSEFFRRKVPHLGYMKAVVATAHKALVRLWVLLRKNVDYRPPEPKPLTERQRTRRIQKALYMLESAGLVIDPAQLASAVLAPA